jgi:hypothetical protein
VRVVFNERANKELSNQLGTTFLRSLWIFIAKPNLISKDNAVTSYPLNGESLDSGHGTTYYDLPAPTTKSGSQGRMSYLRLGANFICSIHTRKG